MKKSLTLITATVLMTLMAGAQLTVALAVNTEKPTPEMKKSFSADAFETKDKSKEGLCSGIGDFKNKNCPQLVQSKSNKGFENNEKQEDEEKIVEVIVERPVYIPVVSEEKSKKEEKEEEKAEKESIKEGKVLGSSTVRPAALTQPTNESSQQIMLLTILIVLTLALTLITEVRTQKVIQQIQTQLNRRKRGGKTSKK